MNYQFNNRLYTSPTSRNDSELRPRFQRNSPQSGRTSPSRSSEESPIHQTFIKFNKISKVRLDPDDFFQGFSEEFVKPHSDDEGSVKMRSHSKENSLVKIKTLEQQLSQREMDYEDLRGENERLKKALEKEIAKRRQVEKNLKTNIVSLSELQRKVREQEINLSNQSKEIRYLEERTYSKEDKIMFSYREKGLLEEIRRLKAAYSSTTGAQFFEKEIRRLTIEYDQIRDENHHLKIAQRTIINRLLHFQKQLKVAIKLEEEFFDLREKYEELTKKERTERKELERLKLKYVKPDSNEKLESLSYSSSQNTSIPKGFQRTISHHHHRSSQHCQRKPNGS